MLSVYHKIYSIEFSFGGKKIVNNFYIMKGKTNELKFSHLIFVIYIYIASFTSSAYYLYFIVMPSFTLSVILVIVTLRRLNNGSPLIFILNMHFVDTGKLASHF